MCDLRLLALVMSAGCLHERAHEIVLLSGDATEGGDTFDFHCHGCHGDEEGGPRGPIGGFVRRHRDERVLHRVLTGNAGMASFDFLSDQELADLLAHLRARFGP